MIGLPLSLFHIKGILVGLVLSNATLKSQNCHKSSFWTVFPQVDWNQLLAGQQVQIILNKPSVFLSGFGILRTLKNGQKQQK